MKRDLSPLHTALFLLLGCVVLRFLNTIFPEAIPNVSPLMAAAYVGAMYLPRRWGWLVGPVTLVLTDLACARANAAAIGTMFSWWTLVAAAVYALAGGLGILLARTRSLPALLAGSVLCSLLFYVAGNTVSWWVDLDSHLTPGYPLSWAGWWQANTTGLPGYVPTWTFLRNAALGDLLFTVALLAAFDRSLFFRAAPRASSQAA